MHEKPIKARILGCNEESCGRNAFRGNNVRQDLYLYSLAERFLLEYSLFTGYTERGRRVSQDKGRVNVYAIMAYNGI